MLIVGVDKLLQRAANTALRRVVRVREMPERAEKADQRRARDKPFSEPRFGVRRRNGLTRGGLVQRDLSGRREVHVYPAVQTHIARVAL